MFRHLSRARVRSARPLTAAAVAVVGAAATGLLSPAESQAALTINLQFPGGGTSMLVSSDQNNTNVPIQVWATVTGAGTITNTAGATTGDFDGLQYLYYNVLSSNAGGTYINGSIGSANLNTTLGFGATGSQNGSIGSAMGGIAVGSNTSIGAMAKPRSASAVFNNNSTDTTQIRVNSANSVSFLVETINFRPGAYAQRNKTTFSVSVPPLSAFNGSIYSQANWFEDTTNKTGGNQSQPSPITANKNGAPVAGSQVVIGDALAGDLNLDGSVNINDFNLFVPNFGKTGTFTFAQGDLNGDGNVNINDFNLFVPNFGQSLVLTPSSAGWTPLAAFAAAHNDTAAFQAAVASVPEPTSIAGVLLAGCGLLARRRKANSEA